MTEPEWIKRLPPGVLFAHEADKAAISGAYASLSLDDLHVVADVSPEDLTVDEHVRPMLRNLLMANLERNYPQAGIRAVRIRAMCLLESREPMAEEKGVLFAVDAVERTIAKVCAS